MYTAKDRTGYSKHHAKVSLLALIFRNFGRSELSQIKNVFPQAFLFKMLNHPRKSFNERLVILRVPVSELHKPKIVINDLISIISRESDVFKRREEFHKHLVERVKRLHLVSALLFISDTLRTSYKEKGLKLILRRRSEDGIRGFRWNTFQTLKKMICFQNLRRR